MITTSDPEGLPHLATLRLAIEQIGAKGAVSDYELTVARSNITQHMIFSLVRKIATFRGTETVEIPEIRVPDTWWDAFKERHFDVLLRWFPVRWRTIQRPAVYRADKMLPAVPLPQKHLVGAFDVLTYLGEERP